MTSAVGRVASFFLVASGCCSGWPPPARAWIVAGNDSRPAPMFFLPNNVFRCAKGAFSQARTTKNGDDALCLTNSVSARLAASHPLFLKYSA